MAGRKRAWFVYVWAENAAAKRLGPYATEMLAMQVAMSFQRKGWMVRIEEEEV